MKKMKHYITAATVCAVMLSSTVPAMAAENGTQETSKAVGSGSWGFDLDDAAQTLAFALKIKAAETADLQDLDADGDGVIDLNDAHQVLRYALKIDAPTHPKSVRVETFQGTTYQLKFAETTRLEGWNFDVDIYEDDYGTVARYIHETGQLMQFMPKHFDVYLEDKIDINEAVAIAENVIRAQCTHCDLSKYTQVRIYHDDTWNSGYELTYAIVINGYETRESISIRVGDYGTIDNLYYSPCIFGDVEVPDIDEKAILQELDKQVWEEYGDTISGYEIEEERYLSVNDDSKVVMQYCVVLQWDDVLSAVIMEIEV